MNKKEIEEMIKLMNENKLSELEIERNGLKIKLKKETSGVERVIEEGGLKQKEIIHKVESAPQQEIKEKANLIEITSPMVGTFYRAPSPEAPPFTDVDKVVRPGDIVCIIEAMKLMNEIKSEVKGKVIEICVDNGASVEYGQTLFKLEPIP